MPHSIDVGQYHFSHQGPQGATNLSSPLSRPEMEKVEICEILKDGGKEVMSSSTEAVRADDEQLKHFKGAEVAKTWRHLC